MESFTLDLRPYQLVDAATPPLDNIAKSVERATSALEGIEAALDDLARGKS